MADKVTAYATKQTAPFGAICDRLRTEIQKALPKAAAKMWHGGPVWFLDENPIVGYNATAKSVRLLFWSGQTFDEPLLSPMGKDKAAQATYANLSDIDAGDLRRWLRKSGESIVDYAGIYAAKRANSAAERKPRAPRNAKRPS